MAEEIKSSQPVIGEESDQLKSQVEKLCDDFNAQLDSNLPDRDELGQIFIVLEKIKAKMSPQDHGDQQNLPRSKREELASLLPTIDGALQKRKQRRPEAEHDPAAEKKAASGCNPFKPRSSQQRSKQQQQGEEDAVTLKLLLRLTEHVLEPEQYYEWTTSYVDEERIFGWSDDAGRVADALVGDQLLFRAAGIAGVHGSGKTALARKVFVHDKAKDSFPLRLWVCVGPPDSEDRPGLLYRMLDNLGLDTAKVEAIVDSSKAVKKSRDEELDRILKEERAAVKKEETGDKKNNPDDVTKPAGAGDDAKEKEELLKEKADSCPAVQKSKIGVLLYILHMTLSRTGYLIVFDDIRAYDGGDGWYSNLALLPPPPDREWGDRLAYGLPKTKQHRSAVLVTCRKEEDARAMVRTGRVFRPPRMEVKDGWMLFKREYKEAAASKKQRNKEGEEDMLLKALEQMEEEIVNRCLGLPVAIAEAARGFALSDYETPCLPENSSSPPPEEAADKAAEEDRTGTATATATASSSKQAEKEEEEEEAEAAAGEAADKSED